MFVIILSLLYDYLGQFVFQIQYDFHLNLLVDLCCFIQYSDLVFTLITILNLVLLMTFILDLFIAEFGLNLLVFTLDFLVIRFVIINLLFVLMFIRLVVSQCSLNFFLCLLTPVTNILISLNHFHLYLLDFFLKYSEIFFQCEIFVCL